MSGTPRVSIAIRAFRRRWLGEAIASVLSQSHRDLELVVYDDAGDLADVAASFADGRVRYHRATEPLGHSGRYKAAVALCHGEYVGLLDDDDRYEPHFVARLLAPLDADQTVAVAFGRSLWDCGGTLLTPTDVRPPGIQADAARMAADFRWVLTPSAALVRRAALADGEVRWPMPDGVMPDMFVRARAAAGGWRFALVDAPLVVKRWHDDQASRSSLSAYDLLVATLEQLPVVDPELDQLRTRHLAAALVRRAGYRILAGDAPGARSDLRTARTIDSRSDRSTRLALGAAAASPGFGALGLRACLALPPFRTRRASPRSHRAGVRSSAP